MKLTEDGKWGGEKKGNLYNNNVFYQKEEEKKHKNKIIRSLVIKI